MNEREVENREGLIKSGVINATTYIDIYIYI